MNSSQHRFRRQPQSQRRTLSVECLERRTLLATNLADGVLTVRGTNGPDAIDIAMEVDAEGDSLLAVTMNGVKTSFDAALVEALRINALGKDDVVSIADEVLVDAVIKGGRGHDSLDGGGGDDEIHGDQGNDSIDGDVGNDELYGDNGTDALDGDEGADYLDGGRGDDDCLGGLDDDVLHGGDGDDHLDGEEGDDYLDGDEGDDEIDDLDDEDDEEVDFDDELELEAELPDATVASVHAKFEIEHEDDGVEVEFEVEVEDATACSVLDLLVDGYLVGQISTDESGHGELNFSSDPDDEDEIPFPVDFPAVWIDSVISLENGLPSWCAVAAGTQNQPVGAE